jgi:hypothetical protein
VNGHTALRVTKDGLQRHHHPISPITYIPNGGHTPGTITRSPSPANVARQARQRYSSSSIGSCSICSDRQTGQIMVDRGSPMLSPQLNVRHTASIRLTRYQPTRRYRVVPQHATDATTLSILSSLSQGIASDGTHDGDSIRGAHTAFRVKTARRHADTTPSAR